MKVWTIFSVALRSLQRARVRSSLTTLGLTVGVAAVVATNSIGSGAKARIEETLMKPESRTIYLGALPMRPDANLPLSQNLQTTDYYAVRELVDHVSAVSPRFYLSDAHAQANGRAAKVTLEGIDVGGFTVMLRTLLEGALFSGVDVQRAANVCVLSESLARKLFPDQQIANRPIRLNNVSFRAVGVVDDIEPPLGSSRREDLHVYIPFTSLLRRLGTTAAMTINAQVEDLGHLNVVQERINDVMETHRSGRKADFRTANSSESIQAYAAGSQATARLLTAMGAIALIVGGIGIMNVMLVSVTERTKEIGLRMAVGTRGSDIYRQFLAEALALSLLGGTIGMAAGLLASVVITHLNAWPFAVTFDSVLIALLCSLTVGVFSGYHPARRAALMRPVEALRIEH